MSLAVRQWDVVRIRINPNDRDEHPAVLGRVAVERRRQIGRKVIGTYRLPS